jgi:lipoprotein signal peptidase
MADIRLRAYGIAAAVFALDRLTKWIVETRVSFTDTYKVIPGFFDIVRSENRGVAFGIFNDSPSGLRTMLLVVLALAAIVGVGFMLRNARHMDPASLWAGPPATCSIASCAAASRISWSFTPAIITGPRSMWRIRPS